MKPERGIIFVICLAFLATRTSGHSWIACTDYLEDNGEDWNPDLCRAFPRHGHRYTPRTGTFGQDSMCDVVSCILCDV